MDFPQFIAESCPGFFDLSPKDQICIIGWYLHKHEDKAAFDNSALRESFRSVHVEPPDVSVYVPRMVAQRPAMLVRSKGGYRLEGSVRRQLDSKYAAAPTVVAITAILLALPDKIPSVAEKAFLREALDCYRVGAFRATIVMVWSLAFDHVRSWILADQARIAAFNNGLATKYPKKGLTVSVPSDFEELKEAEAIEVCRTARLFSKNICDILREKLSRRNMAAHPSDVHVTQHQADDVITDLVNNVILSLI